MTWTDAGMSGLSASDCLYPYLDFLNVTSNYLELIFTCKLWSISDQMWISFETQSSLIWTTKAVCKFLSFLIALIHLQNWSLEEQEQLKCQHNDKWYDTTPSACSHTMAIMYRAVYVWQAAITLKVIDGLHPGVTTVELDNLAAETAATMTTKHPDYAVLAARIAVSNLHKETKKVFTGIVSISNH